jgi:hypothetical protein
MSLSVQLVDYFMWSGCSVVVDVEEYEGRGDDVADGLWAEADVAQCFEGHLQ